MDGYKKQGEKKTNSKHIYNVYHTYSNQFY